MTRRFGSDDPAADAQMRDARKNAERLQLEYDRDPETPLQHHQRRAQELKDMMRRHPQSAASFESQLAFTEEAIEKEKAYQQGRRERAGSSVRSRPSGFWQFTEIRNTAGALTGWNCTLDGRKVGILVLRDDDIWVLSTTGDAQELRRAGVPHLIDDPAPADIMAAFLKLYPDGPRTVDRTLRLPSRSQHSLPSGSPFGPSRNWDEEN